MTLSELHAHPDGKAIRFRFGTIANGVEHAGVRNWPRRIVGKVMSKAEVVAALRSRYRRRLPLRMNVLTRSEHRLVGGIQRHFVGIANALKAAGLAAQITRRTRWSRDEVLRQLARRRAAGLPLNAKAVVEEMPSLYDAAVEFFGSYAVVLRRFGAKPLQQSWTPERVLAELRRRGRGGRILTGADIPRSLDHACARYFGTFTAARAAAGLPAPPADQQWTVERLVETLQERAKQERALTGKTLGGPIVAACRRYFGKLSAALVAAGVDAPERATPKRRRAISSRSRT